MPKEETPPTGQEVKVAHSLTVTNCRDPLCGRPHLVLFDEKERPFAQAVLGPKVTELIAHWDQEKEGNA